MKRQLTSFLALTAYFFWAQFAWAQSAVVNTEQVRAELVAHAPEGLGPGRPMWLGLLIEHKPHWHTYWKNPGDSGLPTRLEWSLPAGATVGEIVWPAPQRLPIGPMVNYGFEGQLLLPSPLNLNRPIGAEGLELRLRADWLVCKEVCIPESGEFSLRVPAAGINEHADFFAAAVAAQPQLLDLPVQVALGEQVLTLQIKGLPADWRGRKLLAFPEEAGVFDHAAAPEQQWQGEQLTLGLPLSAQRSEAPQQLYAVLRLADDTQAKPLRIAYQVQAWPALAAGDYGGATATASPIAPAPAPAPLTEAPPSVWLAMLLALGGGVLLNLMPCVFPVLSLKVLGFAHHGEQRRTLVMGGLAYTAGVVASFLALAGLLLLLRAGGDQLGWGYQLQSPAFVAALALLFTLIALNLLGVFELRAVLPGNLAGLRAANPAVDSALTGVLAVAVASPCTAPFMGVALGVALTLPAVQALAVFAALGLGMAAPYLAATLWPAVARLLPRPGRWMEQFKILMAFPMLATVVWLMWVLGQQVGIDGAAALLGLLVALSLLVWVFGSGGFGLRGRLLLGGLVLVLFAATAHWAWPSLREPTPASVQPAGGGTWEAWSAERVQQAQNEGRTVFVDFTAAWCVTCQFNKRTTLADTALMADLKAGNVLLLRADWTRRDAAISQALNSMGRSGVPVYAVYRPGATAPELLPEILNVAAVRAALLP